MKKHNTKAPFPDLKVFNFFAKNEEALNSLAEIIFKFYNTLKDQHRLSPTNILEFFTYTDT